MMVQVVPATLLDIKMFLFVMYPLVVSIGFFDFNLHAKRGKNCPSPPFTLSLAVSYL